MLLNKFVVDQYPYHLVRKSCKSNG